MTSSLQLRASGLPVSNERVQSIAQRLRRHSTSSVCEDAEGLIGDLVIELDAMTATCNAWRDKAHALGAA